MLASVGVYDVLIALIAGLPGIIAAIAALSVRRTVQTEDGRTLAETVQQGCKAATKTEAVVTRTLGERHDDKPKDPRPHLVPEREDDH